MRRLPRPRSRGFRVMLAMALLAWVMLASGALAGPLYMAGAMRMAATQPGNPRCDGMATQPGMSHRVPVAPAGHGDCCHLACHCLSVCNAVLEVPPSTIAVSSMHTPVASATLVKPASAHAVPPLRPPIA